MYCLNIYNINQLYGKLRQCLMSCLWVSLSYWNFKNILSRNYGLENIQLFKFMSWKNGAYYFKGIRNGKSVFIKTDFAYGLLHNEIIAYEALKHDEGISGSIAKPLMYDKNRFQFVVFAFINGLTLDKHVREKAISHNEFESICQQFVSILNGLYRAGCPASTTQHGSRLGKHEWHRPAPRAIPCEVRDL